MKKPGTVDSRGRIWLLCPRCDDEKGHMVFNPDTWTLHCFRCGHTETAPLDFAVYALDQRRVARSSEPLVLQDLLKQLLPGPGSSRSSALPRHHRSTDAGIEDAFISRLPSGKITGVYLRRPDGSSRFLGERTLGYSGETLWAGGVRTLRVVEGPYDVLDQDTLCLWGLPTASQTRTLSGFSVILTPDGDVWPRPDLLDRWLRPWFRNPYIHVEGIEVLPDELDPDDLPVEARRRMPDASLERLRHRYRGTRRFR